MALTKANATSFKAGFKPWNDGVKGYRNFKNAQKRIDQSNPLFLDSFRPGCTHCGVYAIIHKISGRIYIGSSVAMGKRLHRHRSNFSKRNDASNRLIAAFIESPHEFEFSVVEYTSSLAEARDREQFWINFYQSYREDIGYNCSKSSTSCIGVTRSKETLQKISAALTGRKRGPISEAHRLKIIAANTGRRVTQETKDKARQTRHERKSKWKKVYKLAPNGEILETFDSLTIAAKQMGAISPANIGAVCRGKREKAFGFRWRHA